MAWVWDFWRSNALLTMGVLLFLAGLGVPGPATLAVIAMGALVRAHRVTSAEALLVGTLCAGLGDLISYGIARRGLKGWIEKRKQKPSWQRASDHFEHNAPLTLFLSRWLFTPASMPITYIAGSNCYPLKKYLPASLSGQIVGLVVYGAIGYELGRHWKTEAGNLLQNAAWMIGILAVAAAILWGLRRKALASAA